MSSAAYGWNWDQFVGGRDALSWARRDIVGLDAAVMRASGRTAVIQAGGNLGIFPKRLAQSFQTVYTFEPSPELFPSLVQNAPEENIVRFQAALGDLRQLVGTARVRRTKTHMPAHEGITHIVGPGIVPTLQIDDLALWVCDLICLDLEGYELFALRGAIQTLTRCRPVVVVEINKNIEHYGQRGDDVRALLRSHSYVQVDKQRSDEIYVPQERLR